MALTIDSLCNGLNLTWEEIKNTVTTQQDEEHLRLRHLDAKYAKNLAQVNEITGLMELSRDRLRVSIEYIIALSEIMQNYNGKRNKIIDVNLTEEQKTILRDIPNWFDYNHQKQIDLIESKTNHDLAATTDWLKMQLLTEPKYGLQEYAEIVHWALTSENINGPCFALANKKIAENILIPKLIQFQEILLNLGEEYLEKPILALTHGQPAEYTTLGKKYLNIVDSLDKSLKKLIVYNEKGEKIPFRFTTSIRGAVGNLNDHYAAYPDINWRRGLDALIESLGLEPVDMSDQSESFLKYQTFVNILSEIQSTIRKCGNDFWEAVKDQLYNKKTKKGEKGSSVMAQKKNPWLVEGGLAIMGKGLTQLRYSIETMRNYHQEGDMSRSILTRDIGDDYGKIILGISRIMQEIKNYVPDDKRIEDYLHSNPIAATAPIMTTLKIIGVEGDVYRGMQELSQDPNIKNNSEAFKSGVNYFLDKYNVKKEDKEYIISLVEPKNCIGDTVKMGKDCIERCKKTVNNLKEVYNIK